MEHGGRTRTLPVYSNGGMLDLEIELNRQGIEREIVLLEAASEQIVRKTA